MRKTMGMIAAMVMMMMLAFSTNFIKCFVFSFQLSDNLSINKVFFSMFGNLLITSSFVLLGPLPFIPLEPSVGLIMTGIALAGIGTQF